MKWQKQMIPVTRSTLPPLEAYLDLVRDIWQSRSLTNFGKYSQQLEAHLKTHIGTPNCLLVSNGTVALQLAIKALELKGEVITTAFSFVATTSAISWEGCDPILVDIDPQTFNIDPKKVEAAITPRTTAILATHVFGNPCDIERLEEICRNYNLKLIYDAAHCFGVSYLGKSLLTFGDVATVSFHATKIFHTVEGGLVLFKDPQVGERLNYMRNFGFQGPEKFQGVGINAKNSELHAAMGLCLWPSLLEVLARRLTIVEIYDEAFKKNSLIGRQKWKDGASKNGAYYPIVLPCEDSLLSTQRALNSANVFPRRYFYPCLSRLPYVGSVDVPVAEDISRRILCLPLYPELPEAVAQEIAECVLQSSRI